MATFTGTESIYRRKIVHLVKALCEISADLRRKWRDEIAAKPHETRSPDEELVMLILIALPTSEAMACYAQERVRAQVRMLELVK